MSQEVVEVRKVKGDLQEADAMMKTQLKKCERSLQDKISEGVADVNRLVAQRMT